MKSLILLTILSTILLSAQADNWAVLVAGSNGYWNYRHQADVFHAFQIVKGNGIPESNIIVFAYDDIANSSANPFPGQVFNKPSNGTGQNVYKDITIDYSGDDVNSANFLAVLKGNSTAVGGKKVLNSTSEDYVFIFFADHGAAGLIAFPNDYLYADDLNNTLTYLHKNKRYKQLVFYLEACESGSMFMTLPNNTNIYAVTAANADESSWGTYCPPDDDVNDTEIGSCLGDLFSVNWMENTDSALIKVETLAKQYDIVHNETTLSHVCKFGDLAFWKEPIGDFQGDYEWGLLRSLFRPYDFQAPPKLSSMDSRNIKLAYLERQAHKLNTLQANLAFENEISFEAFQDKFFSNLANAISQSDSEFDDVESLMGSYDEINFPCLKNAVSTYTNECSSLGEYGLKYVIVFVNLCNTAYGQQLPTLIPEVCNTTKVTF